MFGFLFFMVFTLFVGALFIGGIVISIKAKSFENWFVILILMLLFVGCIGCWIMEPPSIYRSCCGIIELDICTENFCENCGAELIPHCVDCGKVCYTAFCNSCGAKQ